MVKIDFFEQGTKARHNKKGTKRPQHKSRGMLQGN